MKQEFKSIEEIKEEYVESINTPYERDTWQSLLAGNGTRNMEHHHDNVAQRYAQQYVDSNKQLLDWKESMMKVHNELDLQGIAKALNLRLGSSIAPHVLPKIKDLQQSNKELVEMLEACLILFEDYGIVTTENLKQLITKHKQHEK